ncbi:hypothetical protein KI387_025714, partial [Taxus chinensis]
AFATAGVLAAGLISFRNGNYMLSQKLMRARVLLQGGTVALMSVLYIGLGYMVFVPCYKVHDLGFRDCFVFYVLSWKFKSYHRGLVDIMKVHQSHDGLPTL